MKKIVRLTERDLSRIVRRVMNENLFSRFFGKKEDEEMDQEEIEQALVSMAKFEFNIFRNYGDSDRPKYKKMFDERSDENTIYVDLDRHFMRGDDFYEYIKPVKKYLEDNDNQVNLDKYNFELDGDEIKITKEENISEQQIRRLVNKILMEQKTFTIAKPKDYDNFQKKCSTKNKGTFRTFTEGTHLRCVKTEGSTFQQGQSGALKVDENPFKTVGKNGTWKLVGNKIELKSTL
jgi:hypothetical protein